MRHFGKRATVFILAMILLTGASFAAPRHADPGGGDFNDEYVFATTRSLNDTDMNPAFKVTLFPVTVLLDTAFLPFAVIAGFVT